MYPRNGPAPLTPCYNWITYFRSLQTYLFVTYLHTGDLDTKGLLRSLGPTTMNELRMLYVCTVHQHKFGATEPPM